MRDETQESFVLCKHCNATLGTPDNTSQGWRIWKWNIDILSRSLPQKAAPVYSTQKWITARLLYLIENTGLRKFHIHPASITTPVTESQDSLPEDTSPPSMSSLLVWVFTPDLLFSSSMPSPGRLDPTRSMKVFYKHQTFAPLKPGEPESASIEDVEFPEELFQELSSVLDASQKVLPPTARKFQGWEVGLLERFDGRDLVAIKEEDREDEGELADVESEGSDGEKKE
jgi:hypothetical protein